MKQVYTFLRKIVALLLNVLVLLLSSELGVQLFISIPIVTIAFAVLISKITETRPKQLYNYHRSEKFFSKGGLRDLIRIPVVLFAFLQDILVWEFWGVFQIFVLLTDSLYFIKNILFWVLRGIIWFLKLFLPFWRIVYHLIIYYLFKWPWWIYKYSFRTIRKTYNWNILRISLPGTFLTLFTLQLFYFLDITLAISGLVYIGAILSLLPLSWMFGEISSLRGQNLMFANFREVRQRYRNGIETVRSILFFITIFVVLLLVETGLNILGWIPKTGIVILGLSMNLSFTINLILIILAILVVFGSIVLPSHRLYIEFSETSLKSNYKLLCQIIKRSLQYIFGAVPATIFGVISTIPAILVIGLILTLTLSLKNNIIELKIDRLNKMQSSALNQTEEHRLRKEINQLQNIKQFPLQVRHSQEMGHRDFLKDELVGYETEYEMLRVELNRYKSEVRSDLDELDELLTTEQQNPAFNQQRFDGLTDAKRLLINKSRQIEKNKLAGIQNKKIDIEYASRRYKQLPIVFYLSGLVTVIIFTFIFTFLFAFYGNFLYKSYLFKNDGTPALWREFIRREKEKDKNQPLLSTSLNIIVALTVIFLITKYGFVESIPSWLVL